jgi:hypothetical protein
MKGPKSFLFSFRLRITVTVDARLPTAIPGLMSIKKLLRK